MIFTGRWKGRPELHAPALTNILFQHVPCWKGAFFFVTERLRCVLRGRQRWDGWRRPGGGQWRRRGRRRRWWHRWGRRRSGRAGCYCRRRRPGVDVDGDVFGLLFLGCFPASGCRVDGGGTFGYGRRVQADDGQWLWGTRGWWGHPGLGSLHNVLALSLLERDGRKKKELSEIGTLEWLNAMRERTATEYSMWLWIHHFVYMKVTSVFCHDAQPDERDFEAMMSEIFQAESWCWSNKLIENTTVAPLVSVSLNKNNSFNVRDKILNSIINIWLRVWVSNGCTAYC